MNDTPEPQDGIEEPLELTAVVLPCVIVTLLPDGNLDIQTPNGSLPVDKMFTASALLARLANAALDSYEHRSDAAVLEIARDMSAARRVKPQ